ncbi:wax ester synthase/diacylglycerol acyltransferase 11 isoform X2 [Arachis hypogaea]|uniref:wax ester synthase/diacylglycerol acyltransferase 11 isoform X2 n=2 Tax=Arachis hypogaea TaxID=3818 RepID=UPI000DECB566|nr:O-acyltransferase WSD1 isoform X2 [Arachis hypogaea]QHO47570.1 O-acyltransferase [Arachis hypogaea]
MRKRKGISKLKMASSMSSGGGGGGGGGEPMSPASRLFHSPKFNCYVMAVMGCKTSVNPQVIKEGLRETILKHPRFTSNLVKKGRKTRWISTTIDLDSHIIVPEINSSEIEFPDRFVEDYISNCTKSPLDITKPLWELHLLNIKTADAESVGVFRMHHSMGDGASLMSLLIASTRKSSDPNALPAMPAATSVKKDEKHKRGFLMVLFGPLMALWWGLVLMWHTFVDLMMFVLTVLFLKDTLTPLKGAPGVELHTKRYVHRIVSMDDIKLLKNQMNATVNDVLLGITQAGISRYLNRPEFGANAKKESSSVLKKIRLRSAILVNIRPVSGIQDIADMMAKKSKVRWGNWIGYIMLPFSISSQQDPLQHIRQAKATIDRKKHSLEAVSTYACAKLVLSLFGVKVAAFIIRRVLLNTTVAFSNMPGPVEEVSFYGHPVAYIAPSVYGHPQALTIHFQSYANKMIISLSVDPSVIPDPYLLCDDFEESLKLMRDVVQKKPVEDAV